MSPALAWPSLTRPHYRAVFFLLLLPRILNSCTDLMKVSVRVGDCGVVVSGLLRKSHQSWSWQAIRLLVMTSTSLQKEIVESGRVS